MLNTNFLYFDFKGHNLQVEVFHIYESGCGLIRNLQVVVFWYFTLGIIYLGFMLLHITNNDDMTKIKQGFTFENFVIFRYI